MGLNLRDWKPAFLAALSEVPVVSRAAKVAGVERMTAYYARQKDPEFAKAWEDAVEAGIDVAEQEAFRRAVKGVQKGVWHQGQLVGEEIVYSDSLMALILKGRRKQLYADRTEITGADGGPVAVDETKRAARIAALMAAAQQRKSLEDEFGDLA